MDYPATFVSHNSLKDCYADFWLMSRCKYHIIANSTFSWWSAWLSQRQGKIVFSPFQWFDKKRRNIRDLIPSAWRSWSKGVGLVFSKRNHWCSVLFLVFFFCFLWATLKFFLEFPYPSTDIFALKDSGANLYFKHAFVDQYYPIFGP